MKLFRKGLSALLASALAVGSYFGGTALVRDVRFARAEEQVALSKEELKKVDDIARRRVLALHQVPGRSLARDRGVIDHGGNGLGDVFDRRFACGKTASRFVQSQRFDKDGRRRTEMSFEAPEELPRRK